MGRIGSLIVAGLAASSCSSVVAASNPVQHTAGHLIARTLAAPLNSVVCTSQENCIGVGTHVTAVTRVRSGLVNAREPDGGFAAITTDRGALWASTPRLVGVKGLDALACATARSCIAVGGNPVSTKYVIVRGVVTRTSDGGHTWKVLPTLPKRVGQLTSISCPTAHFCMAVGSQARSPTAVALVTRSTGEQWTSLTLPRYEAPLALVTCTTPHHCIAEGFSGLISVIVTSDGGATWTQAQLPAGHYPQGAVGIPTFAGLVCMSRTNCLLVGGIEAQSGYSGLIMVSADGGKSWSFAVLPPGAAKMNAISCPTALQCVAVGGDFTRDGHSLILTTTDGGQNWVAPPAPTIVTGLEGVSCPTTTTCVATGFRLTTSEPVNGLPVTVVTSDGGVTWKVTP